MAWLNWEEFKAISFTASSAQETTEEQLTDCVEAAKEILSDLAGIAILTEIGDAVDDTIPKVRRFRRAQLKLAQREMLNFSSFRFTDGGIRKRETDSNAVSTNEYESFAETQKRKDTLYDEAVSIISQYLTTEAEAEINPPRHSSSVPIQIGW